jgi:type IV pilus assembly protein PilQ
LKKACHILVWGVCCAVVAFGSSWAQAPGSDIRVSLDFNDTPISTVLKMLATQNNLNLVVSAAVTGTISITLDSVTLPAALDAILLPNGYNYHLLDNIIIVKESSQWMAGELVARTYDLKYIDPVVAQTAVKPILSEKGQAIVLTSPSEGSDAAKKPAGSQIVIVDYPDVHGGVSTLLEQIDRRRRQVSVEVKIIETNLTKDEKLGINWPKSLSTSINGVPTPDGVTGWSRSASSTEAAAMPLDNGDWQLGYLTVHQVDVMMDFLNKRNNAKLLSNPRLTALDNETALIEIQTVIPIQTINRFSEGAVIQDIVTFQDERVGISLKVTPRINNDSAITMQVNPIVAEIIGYSGPVNNQKPITSERSINTTVTVKDNETIVLGGLLKETHFDTVEKVFLLGSIPIIGGLFTSHNTETGTTDLLILITPRIID